MAKVTARFTVSRVTDCNWAHEVEMVPDYKEGANEDWKKNTPSGVFRLNVRGEVVDNFQQGKPVHITMEFPEND